MSINANKGGENGINNDKSKNGVMYSPIHERVQNDKKPYHELYGDHAKTFIKDGEYFSAMCLIVTFFDNTNKLVHYIKLLCTTIIKNKDDIDILAEIFKERTNLYLVIPSEKEEQLRNKALKVIEEAKNNQNTKYKSQ